MGGPRRGHRQPLPPRGTVVAGLQPPGHGRPPRCLHPVHAVRSCLPRGPGQRRDRDGLSRFARQGRLRHGRPNGAKHLRRLRRVRASVPDGCAHAGNAGRRGGRFHGRSGPRGPERLPLLRGRVPADLPRQGRQDPPRDRAQRAGQRQPALRQGALRLRLRPPQAALDRAADPQGRRAEGRHPDRSFQSDDPLPRSVLGRGARPRRRRLQAHPRPGRAGSPRRLRLGQGLERGSLPVPKARPHRLRHQQCRSLHAALPRIVGGCPHGRDWQRRGHGTLQCRARQRRHHRHRRQSDGKPPGRRDLLQERGARRDEAHRHGPARAGVGAPCDPHAPVPARARRRDAERDAAHDHHRRLGRSAIRSSDDGRL